MRHSRLPLLLVALWLARDVAEAVGAEPIPETIRVMSFNLYHGGDGGKQPLDQTIEVIKQSDIVGLQETAGFARGGGIRPDNAAKFAESLGWHYLDQGSRTGIISRFKIIATTPGKWGVQIETPSGQQVYVFNVHLVHSPYQPYQLLRIPYENAPFLNTADEAIRAAQKTRGAQVQRILAEVRAVLPKNLPVFITGDFNEPSHLDWNAAAAKANYCPLEVHWPSTRASEAAGFQDAYRSIYPDPVKHRGLTWTPVTKETDPKDHHDRLDFVFAGGAKVQLKAAKIVGEKRGLADIVVTPYPSDHRAVVIELQFPIEKPAPPKTSRTGERRGRQFCSDRYFSSIDRHGFSSN